LFSFSISLQKEQITITGTDGQINKKTQLD